MSIYRGMSKEDMVHIHNAIFLSHKKEWNNAICSNTAGTRDFNSFLKVRFCLKVPISLSFLNF